MAVGFPITVAWAVEALNPIPFYPRVGAPEPVRLVVSGKYTPAGRSLQERNFPFT